MPARSKLPTHRLYVMYKNGTAISKVFNCISSAWFYGNTYMKKFDVQEIRIIKIKP